MVMGQLRRSSSERVLCRKFMPRSVWLIVSIDDAETMEGMGVEVAAVHDVDAIMHLYPLNERTCSGVTLVEHHGLIHHKQRSSLLAPFPVPLRHVLKSGHGRRWLQSSPGTCRHATGLGQAAGWQRSTGTAVQRRRRSSFEEHLEQLR